MSFEKFTLQCARAFGALIEMRDDPMDAPIPESFTPSTYHTERAKVLEREIAALEAMTNEQRIAYGVAKIERSLASLHDGLRKNTDENARLDAMASQVQAWQPPSKDHEGLKKFMLEQIAISRDRSDYYHERIAELKAMHPLQIWRDEVQSSKDFLASNQKSDREEIERCHGRTQWVRQLRESLKQQQAA